MIINIYGPPGSGKTLNGYKFLSAYKAQVLIDEPDHLGHIYSEGITVLVLSQKQITDADYYIKIEKALEFVGESL